MKSWSSCLGAVCLAVLVLGADRARGETVERVHVSVGTFESTSPDFTWCGEKCSAQVWVKTFVTRLSRAFDSNGAVILGKTNGSIRVEGKVGFAGEGSLVVSVAYRAVEGRTGRTAWEDEVRIESEAFAVKDLKSFVTATSDAASGTIVERTVANVVPYRVVARGAEGELSVAGGGGVLCVGECLTVFAPDGAGEVLGTVQIIRVEGRMACALVVEGETAKIPMGARLRRIPLVSSSPDVGETRPK